MCKDEEKIESGLERRQMNWRRIEKRLRKKEAR